MDMPLRITRSEFDTLKAIQAETIQYADAPAQFDRLSELGLVKPMLGKVGITTSGHLRLAAGVPWRFQWRSLLAMAAVAGAAAWIVVQYWPE